LQNVKYGQNFYNYDNSLTISDAPVWKLANQQAYSWNGYSSSSSYHLSREGAWSDVTLSARTESQGKAFDLQMTFKNEMGRVESAVKINTPFQRFT
jgi:hypothetical protein